MAFSGIVIPLNGLIPPHFMPVPSHNQDFKIHMSCFFVFSELRGFVRFVDIGGIVDHYCLLHPSTNVEKETRYIQYGQLRLFQ
jgi:hypothetical protein